MPACPSRCESHHPRCLMHKVHMEIFSPLHPRAHAGALPPVEYLDTNFLLGVPMPRYFTQHTLACLTRQGAEVLAQRMQAGGTARAERVDRKSTRLNSSHL